MNHMLNQGMKWMAGIGMLAMLGACGGASTENGPQEAPPVAIRTAVAETQDISEYLEFTGDVESPLSVEIISKTSGRLEKLELVKGKKSIPVVEGLEVKQGDQIAEVDHEVLAAEVALAGAQVQAAEVTLEEKDRENRRMESLYKEDVATEQQRDTALTEFKSAQAAVAQAQAQLRLARANLAEAFIHAPMDGVVVKRHVDPGAMVGASTPIVMLEQMTPLRLMLSIPARMLPLLQAGETPVEVRLEGGGDRVFQCKVTRIFPVVNTSTRTATVEVRLDNTKDATGRWAIYPGMYATATLRLSSREQVITMPASALVRVLDKQIAFVVDGTIARAREVTTGIRNGDRVEIVSGIAAGEEYVVMGQNKLTDGVRVERVIDRAHPADEIVSAPAEELKEEPVAAPTAAPAEATAP